MEYQPLIQIDQSIPLESPTDLLETEGSIMKINHEPLYAHIMELDAIHLDSSGVSMFLIGALSAYNLIRRNAELVNIKLPPVTPAAITSFMAERRQEPPEDSRKKTSEFRNSPLCSRILGEANKLPEANKHLLVLGAEEVSSLMSRSISAQNLEAIYGNKT